MPEPPTEPRIAITAAFGVRRPLRPSLVLRGRGEGPMPKQIGVISIIGFCGLLAAVNAQAASPLSGAPFEGTYQFVSTEQVNETYTSYNGQTGMCPSRRPGPLHVAGGSAHYTTATGYRLKGIVGAQGELAMQSPMIGSSRPFTMGASGSIDGNGTAHVRQTSSACSYDFTWQKAAK